MILVHLYNRSIFTIFSVLPFCLNSYIEGLVIIFTIQGEISNLKPALWGDSTEKTNQPRPVSILELPYGEGDTATPESSGNIVHIA